MVLIVAAVIDVVISNKISVHFSARFVVRDFHLPFLLLEYSDVD